MTQFQVFRLSLSEDIFVKPVRLYSLASSRFCKDYFQTQM